LIDIKEFREKDALDKKLSEIFSMSSAAIVGFSFENDFQELFNSFPEMNFYKYITYFIDA